jgi:DNA primase large subunit
MISREKKSERILAKYPFLPEAFEVIKDERIEDILYSEAFRRARELAVTRVQSALRNDEKAIFVDNVFEAILSFYISKAMIACINDRFLLRRHAVFEAKNAYYHLEKESREVVDEIAESLGIIRNKDKVSFVTFLKYAPNGYGKWKLVNTKLSDGMVEVDGHTFLRIVQEAIRERVERISFVVKDIDKAIDLSAIHAELSSRKVAQKTYAIEFESFPPCMKNIIAQIENSINVSHLGRFSLVAFLNGIGMKEEEIMKILMPTPDFDDRVTRYQVEHITGKEYSAPSCNTMRTYSLCFEPDNLCAKIKHPMQYYEYKINHKDHGRVPSKEV